MFEIAYNKAGFWGQLFTDAPGDVANQLCNAFASDRTDLGNGGSSDSSWKSTGEANASSPDNLLLGTPPTAPGRASSSGVQPRGGGSPGPR